MSRAFLLQQHFRAAAVLLVNFGFCRSTEVKKSPFEIAAKRLEIGHMCQWEANGNMWASYRMRSSRSARTPNRGVVNRRPQIDRWAAWSPLWWWSCLSMLMQILRLWIMLWLQPPTFYCIVDNCYSATCLWVILFCFEGLLKWLVKRLSSRSGTQPDRNGSGQWPGVIIVGQLAPWWFMILQGL